LNVLAAHWRRKSIGRENKRRISRDKTQEYRKTLEYKIKAEAYNALETTRIYKRVFARRSHFFRAGKPVGPFDPNEILNRRLLKALQELREGNLKPLKRDNAYE
jgi:hypothetical protein